MKPGIQCRKDLSVHLSGKLRIRDFTFFMDFHDFESWSKALENPMKWINYFDQIQPFLSIWNDLMEIKNTKRRPINFVYNHPLPAHGKVSVISKTYTWIFNSVGGGRRGGGEYFQVIKSEVTKLSQFTPSSNLTSCDHLGVNWDFYAFSMQFLHLASVLHHR